MFGLHKQMRMRGQCVCMCVVEICAEKGTREPPSHSLRKAAFACGKQFQLQLNLMEAH